ncbi:methyltransferase [Porticoccus sp. W117]|uniref:class I SAM-dependent methyltransferase n=1 Tax=Porticoccus sp. W117 TaxID=3054777 RepID=UPI00259447A8|nr:methyltransferase [Porticoccus sp. W117]MDM3871725.1 methyltransferase [Porticoccus sp. W117]
MKLIVTLATALVATSLAADDQALQRAIDGNHRIAEHKARDQYRHPAQTLEFFRIKPGQTVVEITPGSWQWYTEILAPYLGKSGTLYAASGQTEPFQPTEEMLSKLNEEQRKMALARAKQKLPIIQKFEKHPKVFANAKLVKFNPFEDVLDVPAGSADRVLTFRNVHSWTGQPGGGEKAFALFAKALKPGGLLGVVEHRADKASGQGYVTVSDVVKLAEGAGFRLIDTSEVNANPKDSKDYARGVWALPPRLWANDGNNEKYIAIGESDRMTLLFEKL